MDKEYDIGYGKPPKATRFKKGQSGNPKGRSKGRQNLKTDLEAELAEFVQIREGGQLRKISKQRAVVKSLLAKAVKGDTRAADVLLKLISQLLSPPDDQQDDNQLSASDQEILNRFFGRNGGKGSGEDSK